MSRERTIERERLRIVYRLERWLEKPMALLGAAWLVLLVLDLTRGLGPVLSTTGTLIWIAFVAEFALKLAIAPRKLEFLRRRWLTALSLALPALRIARVASLLRAARVARAARGVRLVRVLGTVNRGMNSLGRTMSRRGFGYVVALTAVVLFAGAAGIYAFESGSPHPAAPREFGAALWWTAMMLTTMGSEYWPQTAEGRILCLLLAFYSFATFSYLTATLATFFVGQDAAAAGAPTHAQAERIEALATELRLLRASMERRAASPAEQEPGSAPPRS